MTQPTPDDQLRHLLATHDRLLAETAQQNRALHEWAVRFGPRPGQTMQPTSSPPHLAPGPSFRPPTIPMQQHPQRPPLVPPGAGQPPASLTKRSLSTTQIIARFVAGAGAIVTLVGIAFILVLAAQYGYFGPAPRTISAAALGVVLSAGAFWLRRRDPDNAGAAALLATGMAAGFLSLVAATTLYHLMPGALGLVLAGLLGIAVSLVAARWRSEWLACLAIAAALVIGPWVSGDVHLGAAFMVVLSGVAAVAHLRMHWPVFQLARTLPTTVLLVYLASMYGVSSTDAWLLVGLSAAHASIGIASTLLGRLAAVPEQWALASVIVGPALPLMLLAGEQLPRLQGAGVAGAAAVAYVLVVALPGTQDWLKATGVALGGVFALQAVALATDLNLFSVLVPGLAVAYAAAAASLRNRAVGLVALVGSAVGILGWVGYGIPAAFGIRFSDLLIGSLLIAALAGVGHLAARRILRDATPRWLRYVLVAFGLLGAAAAVTSTGFLLGRAVGSATTIHQASSVAVTVGWALASVVVLRRPLRSVDHAGGWIRLGLALAAAATGKLFLVDLALLPGLARGIAFLLVGLLLLFLGISYAKAYERALGVSPP
ncbi:MAG: DUF2339 domain-containing protein [Propionibacteriaceae bacterium]